MSGGKLPEGWVGPQLDEIATDINYGYTASSTSENIGPKMLRITDIQDNKVDWNSVPFCKIEDNQKNKYLLCNGDLVFARTGATVGKSFLINEDISNIVFASYLIRVRCNKKINSHYLSYFFRSPTYWSQITEFSAGIGQPNVNGSKLKKLNLPLTSVYEQKIIAEKLDTLLAQVDSTKARLEQISQILKRFRQAILAAAISGKLTDKWRKLTDLQTIWKSHTLGELVTIDRGSSPRPIKDYITTDENGVNWIKIGDTKEGEKYIRSTKERITKEGSKKSRKVTPGDFILSNSMSLGRAYIVEIEGYVHDGWFILRLPENIDKNYFYYLLSSSQLQTQFSSLAVGGVVQNIRSELVKQAIVNIPPLPEQHEIVRRVEQLFAWADTIEKQVNSALTRVNSLTQSILAKAFRGELTAQWRAENPDLISGENSAAALLEKIKAERAASGGKKTSRKKA